MRTIKLEKTFIGRGETKEFKFKQITSSPYGYIYEVTSSKKPHYEVFKKQVNALCLDFVNRIYSDDIVKENYPKQNAFGKTAWTTLTLKRAKEHLKILNSHGAETLKAKN